ncbi:hypothetical protein [Glaciimonas sp. PCH181]|uniref:hypothetical protein n=1 Tax=Glaciimonas sp. PCH181 TaxID=2133943 RepID=UPI0011B1FBCD|nr:hypothetical protein [Glaciimonas sp. PCH181]
MPNGEKVNVPTTATANVSNSSIANSAAGALLNAAVIAGLIEGVDALRRALNDSATNIDCSGKNPFGGDKLDPFSFCTAKKPDPASPNPLPVSGWQDFSELGADSGYHSSPQTVCDLRGANLGFDLKFSPASGLWNGLDGTTFGWCNRSDGVHMGHAVTGDPVLPGAVAPQIPVTSDQLAAQMKSYMDAHPDDAVGIFQGLRDAGLPAATVSPLIDANTPVTIYAPSVTVPSAINSTSTIQNSDGTTSTATRSQVFTIEPTTTGTTAGTISANFPSKTNTTTTTINNSTGAATSTSTTTSNPAAPTIASVGNSQGKECGTPGRHPCQIDETGTPLATAVDGNIDLSKIDAQNNINMNAVGAITPASQGLLTSWIPQIQTADCVNPSVPTPITGVMRDVEICAPVNTFKTFINGVLCVLCLFGCVAQVQSAIKA